MSKKVKNSIVGAIEAGGTKFVCAIGSGPGDRLLARTQFPTGDNPARLMKNITAWFKEQEKEHGRLAALGVASFGPVDLDEDSLTYGFITTTPKPGWKNTNLVGPLRKAFPRIPIGFDTDVNGAALGEWRWGAAKGLDDFVYITVGTGIGGGGMARGKLLHGLVHPEMGHIPMPRLNGDKFKGVCPFHGRCWEGLCSGPAIARRAGMPSEQLSPDHPAWSATIQYMAYALATLACVLSPKRIIIGGSVRKAGQLGEEQFIKRIRSAFRTVLAGYIDSPVLTKTGISEFIVPPKLGDDAGICGAIALAHEAQKQSAVRTRIVKREPKSRSHL